MEHLEPAFGMEHVQATDAQDGTLMHTAMRRGVGVVGIDAGEAVCGSPGVYLVVDDVEAHHVRVEAAIVYRWQDTEFGARRHRAGDPEGREWSFRASAPSTEPRGWG